MKTYMVVFFPFQLDSHSSRIIQLVKESIISDRKREVSMSLVENKDIDR